MAGILDSVNQRTQLVGQNRLELLLFKLNGRQRYGINVFKVREVLQYQAELRLPRSWPRQKKLEKVAYVIKILGLEDVVNSIVGDVENRGISGGQRKRVNIGMELVADPTFLA